ncbi:MAG: hypothetical protein LBC28_01905 [Oscillospiraceae bacterium]|jgi:uncharacterized membrane protein|nr:hypothetical protein [Oscillospiraceae bacterium]
MKRILQSLKKLRSLWHIGLVETIFGSVLILFGAATFIFDFLRHMTRSVFSMGATLLLLGSYYMHLGKTQKVNKAYELSKKDERNVLIKAKSGYIAFGVSATLLAVMSIIFMALEYELASSLTSAALIITVVSYFIASIYYNKRL